MAETIRQPAISPDTTNPPRRGDIARDALLVISAVLMAVTLYMVFFWVPTELNLGISQRIFYFHVPLGWLGMLSIMIVAIASIVYLITGKEKWDALAYTTAELGVVFASLILVTGSIWAKGDLGWWWTWDAKLTTTLVLWFIYVGYLMIRAHSPNRDPEFGAWGPRFLVMGGSRKMAMAGEKSPGGLGVGGVVS